MQTQHQIHDESHLRTSCVQVSTSGREFDSARVRRGTWRRVPQVVLSYLFFDPSQVQLHRQYILVPSYRGLGAIPQDRSLRCKCKVRSPPVEECISLRCAAPRLRRLTSYQFHASIRSVLSLTQQRARNLRPHQNKFKTTAWTRNEPRRARRVRGYASVHGRRC